ncbi:hypothetical protein ACOMHN_029635 [Nucella lapillus]
MATPRDDVHGPLSPSKQPFPPLSSNADLMMSCPVTSAQMTAGPVTSGIHTTEAKTSFLGTVSRRTPEATKLQEGRRAQNGAEEDKEDHEEEGMEEDKDGQEDRREQEARTDVDDSWPQAEPENLRTSEKNPQEDRPPSSSSSTSAACTSACCQPAQPHWKPSTCAVKFSIDSILGLSTAARTSRREDIPRSASSADAGSPWVGGLGCPYTLCPCGPNTSSPHAVYFPKAPPVSLHSLSAPAPAPVPASATSTSTHSLHFPQALSTCSSSPRHSPPPPPPPPQGLLTARKKELEEGRKADSGEEGVENREEWGEEEEEEEEEEEGKKQSEEQANFPWLQCTRYHPPKLQRSKKKDGGGKKRKLGRNPRVPFTQHQVAVLEEKFRRTHYLSSMDVAELSSALSLSETRVKIWFQNRRARERREREASQRAHLLTQKPYQPLSIPSVTWALTSQLSPPPSPSAIGATFSSGEVSSPPPSAPSPPPFPLTSPWRHLLP